eukprot:TRINITY_DN6117_c0_g1_i2.p1 TRINITY_DN6117_c0_g1~~TRINITY_DN6117_c0_g1_i2.p1  ORF type:complete len:591 (+),score=78.24 TRINITY_DN6117_c0_g1_i2:3-1775(+)
MCSIAPSQDSTPAPAIKLSSDEAALDSYMIKLAAADATDGTWTPRSQHDYATLKRLRETQLHQVIDGMPKGPMLHCHRAACFNYSEVVAQIVDKNPTYAQEYGAQVYIYNVSNAATERDGKKHLHADVLCPKEALEYEATLLQDANIEDLLTYWSLERIDMFSLSDSQMWDEFELRFDLPKYAFRWEPVARDFVLPSLVAEAVRHGISYLEPAGSLGKIFRKTCNASGYQDHYSRFTAVEEVNLYDTYINTSASGVGVNLVCSSFRGSSNMMAELEKCMDVWRATKNNIHTRVVAWDVVGREDRFGLAEDMTDVWDRARAEGIPVVPHAGETIYPEALPTPFLKKSPASNLRLHMQDNNTKRVGHAIALSTMEPAMVQNWMLSGIAVVATPISNQLLGYVQGSGFHQACELAMNGIKVALSHDDAPIFSREHSVSHDFGYVFRSCHTCGSGLGLLKQMIIDGWDASLLGDSAKEAKRNEWVVAWDAWVASQVQQVSAQASSPRMCSIAPSLTTTSGTSTSGLIVDGYTSTARAGLRNGSTSTSGAGLPNGGTSTSWVDGASVAASTAAGLRIGACALFGVVIWYFLEFAR